MKIYYFVGIFTLLQIIFDTTLKTFTKGVNFNSIIINKQKAGGFISIGKYIEVYH